ncbi:RIP metalloprotease RseP [uncultured Phascolarctobacterium sp.]|uniref:RIP metalloprotease RseP n=1 Tax=uncultured Phascolarctobacterium sp. TaxID=512296 RepID=UPI0025CBEE40|nr:RIP metalloprotease RseP [uncultured Phascolarctobacterium sp.]
MLTILAAIFVFGVLVTVHEFGHFITAKMTGMRVDEFAIGFGPKIYQQKDGETLYSLRAIPLGGYNKIAGMDPDDPVEPNAFNSKPIPARMLVILAGALMNFILPIILFSGIFMVEGRLQLVNEPVLGNVVNEMAAARAGLKAGDRIVTIDGKNVETWTDVVLNLRKAGTEEVTLTAERNGVLQTYKMTPMFDKDAGRPLIGVSPKFSKESLGFFGSIKEGFIYTKNIGLSMVSGLYKIVSGNAPADVAGPIGVAQMAGQVAEKGLLPLMNFVAFLSINLGVINLLPLPALDGGHFVLLLLEALRGKPLGGKAMTNIQMVGVALILALTVFSTFKDITR